MTENKESVDFVNDQLPSVGRRYSHTPSIHEHDSGFVWNHDHEELIKKFGEQAHNYSILHDRTAKYYDTLYKYMFIPSNVFMGVIGFIQFAQLSDTSSCTTWNYYLSGFLSALAVFLQILMYFLDFQTTVAKHNSVAVVYENLWMDISMELVHPKEKRTNVRAFFRKVRQTLIDTKKTSPDIPNAVLDKFVNSINKTEEDGSAILPIHVHANTFTTNTNGSTITSSTNELKQTPPPDTVTTINNDHNNDHNNQLNLDPQTQPQENDECFSNIQDEFTKRMEEKIRLQKQKKLEYELSRFSSK